MHEMQGLFSAKNKKNIINLWSAEYAQTVVKIKQRAATLRCLKVIDGGMTIWSFTSFSTLFKSFQDDCRWREGKSTMPFCKPMAGDWKKNSMKFYAI